MDQISVIMPFKDGHQFVHEALTSIATQNGLEDFDLEVVIVDDFSDHTLVILADQYPFKVKVIANPDPNRKGAGYARGLAIASATGRFVAFLDCDDIWAPEKLKTQISQMKAQGWALSFGGYGHMVQGDGLASAPYVPSGPYTWIGFLSKQFTIGCLTVIYDRNSVADPIPSHLRRRNDYHMWAQIIRQIEDEGMNWGSVDHSIGFYRVRKGSLSSSKSKAILGYWIFLGVVEPKLWRRAPLFAGYFLRTVFRRLQHG